MNYGSVSMHFKSIYLLICGNQVVYHFLLNETDALTADKSISKSSEISKNSAN